MQISAWVNITEDRKERFLFFMSFCNWLSQNPQLNIFLKLSRALFKYGLKFQNYTFANITMGECTAATWKNSP